MKIPPALDLRENLTERFVAFLDVMGFKDLVNSGKTANLEAYFLSITDVLSKLRSDEKIESFLISDAIILISPKGLKGLKTILMAIRKIQSALLWRKILLRGAVSYGEVFYDPSRNIVVGKGFIKAFLLEKEAVYPRVIIDPSIVKLVSEDRSGFLSTLQDKLKSTDDRLVYSKSEYSRINDDSIFIDYANKTILERSINGNINKIYDSIGANLYSDQRLYSKYVWLRDYFIERMKVVEAGLRETRHPHTYRGHTENVLNWISKFERL